jgi:hypothetical protein
MFTDIAGYSQKTSNQTHEQNAQLVQRHAELIQPLVKRFAGTVVKEIGDAVLATFPSAREAVESAMAIQDKLASINKGSDGAESLRIRVAVNVGEVLVRAGDIFGEAVNVAARMEAETPVDEIYVSEAAYLTMNRSGIPLQRIGVREFKGISEPVTLYGVERQAGVAKTRGFLLPYGGKQLQAADRRERRRRWWAAAAAAAIFAGVGLGGAIGVPALTRKVRVTNAMKAVANSQWEQLAADLERLSVTGDLVEPQFDVMHQRLAALRPSSRTCSALSTVERSLRNAPKHFNRIARLKLQGVRKLLEANELAEAEQCLQVLPYSSHSLEGRLYRLNQSHLIGLKAIAERSGRRIKDSLRLYEELLKTTGAPDEHLPLMLDVIRAGYTYRVSRPVADSLVKEHLQSEAAPVLATLAQARTTSTTTRNWVIARLETVGKHVPLDWVGVYASQLNESSCALRRAAIDRLRALNRLSVAGVLLREADRADRCTRNHARDVLRDLVGGAQRDSIPFPKAVFAPVTLASTLF